MLVSVHLAMVCVSCLFSSFSVFLLRLKQQQNLMKMMFACIHFPVWPYHPQIMKKLYFILVNCRGWKVCNDTLIQWALGHRHIGASSVLCSIVLCKWTNIYNISMALVFLLLCVPALPHSQDCKHQCPLSTKEQPSNPHWSGNIRQGRPAKEWVKLPCWTQNTFINQLRHEWTWIG